MNCGASKQIPINNFRKLAGSVARSPIFARGRVLYTQNRADCDLPLNSLRKLQIGLFLILEDYSKGIFPPRFEDRAAAYAAEVAYRESIGLTAAQASEAEMRKPFWNAFCIERYLGHYAHLVQSLELVGLRAPARLLELGCGTGWMAEWLAIGGYEVTGTSISPDDIADARKRIASVQAKGLQRSLRFEVAPMESVADQLGPRNHYAGVFVYEALHHAFDWRKALDSGRDCLQPGGWLLICNEPNLIHTYSSYRLARLTNTHEIGFSRGELIGHLRQNGFADVRYLSSPFHFGIKAHWICARKSPLPA
jgi:SAM-dependent methyltransferase